MALSLPILTFRPSLVFPLADGTDSRAVEYFFDEMERELARYQGRRMDSLLSTEMSVTITQWERRLAQYIPGIKFTVSAKGDGWLQVTGYIARPEYVLAFRAKVPNFRVDRVPF